MNTRLIRAELSCLLLLLAGGAVADEPAATAPEVAVARPLVRDVTDYEDFIGRAEAATRVDLRARVTGYLLKTSFQDGADVKEGEVLFEIDPRPYRAEMDRADAALTLAEAQFALADANHKRAAALLAQANVSREELDKAVAERAMAEAGLRAAKAVRDLARLNLDFTRVVAPISGQIGRRLVDPGNVVKADETTLAVLVTQDPIYVYFNIGEPTYLRQRKAANERKANAIQPAAIGLTGEEGFPHRGAVDFTDNRVDTQTGALCARAVLPNKDALLKPGASARVRLAIGEPYKAVLVPVEAVMTVGDGMQVFVVNDKHVIEERKVVLGPTHDGLRVVANGLKADDRVVIERPDALRSGTAVQPRQAELSPRSR